MFCFLFFSFSKSIDLEAVFEGEWRISKIPENGNRNIANQDELFGIAFSKQNETEKIVGTFWHNDRKPTYKRRSLDYFLVDKFEVQISEEKIKFISTKTENKKELELDIEIEDELTLKGEYDEKQIQISFYSESSATITFDDEQYALDRDISEESAPVSDLFKKINGQPTGYLANLLQQYSKYLPVVYTAVFLLLVQIIIGIFICNKKNKEQKKGRKGKKGQKGKQQQKVEPKVETKEKEEGKVEWDKNKLK